MSVKMYAKQTFKYLREPSILGSSYYFLGLAIQKATIFLLVPLWIKKIGQSGYSDYALILSIVQICGCLSSLGIPQIIIPIWYQHDAPKQIFRTSILMLLFLSVVTAPPIFYIFQSVLGSQLVESSPGLVGVMVVIMAGMYNISAIYIALARINRLEITYLISSTIGLVSQIVGLQMSRTTVQPAFVDIVYYQTAATVVSIILMVKFLGTGEAPKFPINFLRDACYLVRNSLPMCGYSIFVLYVMAIDKWVFKTYFPNHIFSSYVIDYQFAFAIMIVPSAISIRLTPKVSEMISQRRYQDLAKLEKTMVGLTIAGSVALAAVIYIYAYLTGINLTFGYWIIAFGFVIEGIYVVVSNRILGTMKFNHLLIILLSGAISITLNLFISISLESPLLAYISTTIYSVTILVIALGVIGFGLTDLGEGR
jgi:O-antigen/teichoic acid export membrane protein